MRLPRFTAKTGPPTETGLARAQDIGALTRTGGQEFAALAQLGGAMQRTAGLGFQAYMQRQALDDQVTMGEISKRAVDANTEAENTIDLFDPSVGSALPDNPKEYYDGTKINRFDNPQKEKFRNSTYKKYETKILSLAKGIKNPKTRQAWINSQLPNAYERFTAATNLKHQEYQEDLILGNAENAARNGDIGLAKEWVEIASKYGLIERSVATKLKKAYEKMAIRAVIWGEATAVVRFDGEVDWALAVQWFSVAGNIKGIDSAIIDKLLEDARTQLANQKKRDDAILEKRREESRDFLNDKFANNQIPTADEIDNSGLDEDEQKEYIKWAARGRDIIINQSDPQTELEISTRVRIRPETITPGEIMKLVPKGIYGGLSLRKAESLVDKLLMWGKSPKDPKISSFAKRGHDVIDELENMGKRYGLKGAKAEKDWKTTEDIAEFYNMLNEYHDALDTFMDTEPAPVQVREFVDNILTAEKQAQAESAIRRWWRGHMPNFLGGKAGLIANLITEPGTQFDRPKSETEFNAQVARIKDEDEALAFYNLWKDDFK